MNGNSCNLTEEDYLEYGKIFCEIFDGKISRTKWDYFCEANDIPTAYKTFRFDKKNILDIFIENFNATKVWEKQIWFNNGEHQIRISDWKIELIGVPDGYKKGRMKRL